MMRDILLAYSGGIDSSAAVEILRQMGYMVHLVTIDMTGSEKIITQAREGAQRVGAPLHIVDARDMFKREIIDYFCSEYLSGRTPAPCTRCNTLIKWELLAQKADELGIYHISTGHYFRIVHHEGHTYVARALDPQKDQSYYLWGVREELLRRAVIPLSEHLKRDVKASSHLSQESMGICFLEGRHYTELLGDMASGEVVDGSGVVVGRHNGIARYTIGQRRGEGIPQGMRVVGIRADTNQLCVGLNEELYTSHLSIEGCHFTNIEEVLASQDLTIMIRGIGRNPKGRATLSLTPHGADITLLDDRAWAPAPGQPVVIYIDNRVVGGGKQACFY